MRLVSELRLCVSFVAHRWFYGCPRWQGVQDGAGKLVQSTGCRYYQAAPRPPGVTTENLGEKAAQWRRKQ